MGPMLRVAALWLPLALLAAHPAFTDDFYRGKQLTIVAGSAPGGGYDAYARLLQHSFGNHIPGRPNVVVENMPGAASWTAVLHLDNAGPPDGTTVAIFNAGIITDGVINPARGRRKLSDYAWLGSVTRDVRTCYVATSLGLTSWQDLKGAKETTLGATGVGAGTYNDILMLHNLFHLNVRPILGYPGRAEVHLAIARGELDGECGSTASLPDGWLRDHTVTMLLRLAAIRTPEVPESVPYAADLLDTSEEKQIFDVLTVANEVGRPFIVSKRVPAERLAILRAAFDATMQDPDFLAYAAKQKLPVLPISGEEAEKLVARIYDAPPEVAAKARAAITPSK